MRQQRWRRVIRPDVIAPATDLHLHDDYPVNNVWEEEADREGRHDANAQR